jgi:hypothetical protein
MNGIKKSDRDIDVIKRIANKAASDAVNAFSSSLNINSLSRPTTLSFSGGGSSGGGGGTTSSSGAAFSNGTGIPTGGKDGDYYIRTSTGDLYYRSTGTWAIIMNLVGPQGPAGSGGSGSSAIVYAVALG